MVSAQEAGRKGGLKGGRPRKDGTSRWEDNTRDGREAKKTGETELSRIWLRKPILVKR